MICFTESVGSISTPAPQDSDPFSARLPEKANDKHHYLGQLHLKPSKQL